MSLSEERCPYCFRKFEDKKYSDDPLLIHNGSKFVYDDGSGLLVPQSDISQRLHKGSTIIQNKHIKELQDANDDNKPSGGWTPVEGAPDSFWIPNKIHIKELRQAIESGLGIGESTLDDDRTTLLGQYFNYDEEGIQRRFPLQRDWNDPDLTDTIWMGNISHMHIEDLRIPHLAMPMYIINGGVGQTETIDWSEVDICFEQWKIGTFWMYNPPLPITYYNGAYCGGVTIDYTPDIIYVGYGAPGYYWRWIISYDPFDWVVVSEPILSGAGIKYRGYKDSWINSGHYGKILCIPKTYNLNYKKYVIQEIISDPILVLETPGYPCQMYAGDSWRYAVPYQKSPKFLEDLTASSSKVFDMPKIITENTVIFKDENMAVSASLSGITEPGLESRRLDPNSWGQQDPSECLRGIDGLWGGVGKYGQVSCGTCSVFIPKTWSRNEINIYKENRELGWIFGDGEEGNVVYSSPRANWVIDIRGEIMETVYDPSTNTDKNMKFGGNYLLAKRNDIKNVAGIILAKDKEEKNDVMETGSVGQINLKENPILRSIKCQVDNVFWTRVENFNSSLPTDTHFRVEGTTIYFGDDIHGKLPEPGSYIKTTYYRNEILYTKYYANGMIVVPYDVNLKDVSIYVYIEYYNAPSNYYTFVYPVTNYEVSYWSKPSLIYLPMGLDGGAILHTIIEEPYVRLLAG